MGSGYAQSWAKWVGWTFEGLEVFVFSADFYGLTTCESQVNGQNTEKFSINSNPP